MEKSLPKAAITSANDRHGDRGPAGDARAPRGFAQPVVLAVQRQRPGNKRIDRQGQGQQKRETTYLWHE